MSLPDRALLEQIRAKTRRYTAPLVPWPEMRGVLRVLDFGGSFGVHYRQAMADVKVDRKLEWAVVERPEIVAMADWFQARRLRFFTSIAAASAWFGRPDVVHSNGALQYSQRPYEDLDELIGLGAPVMIWKRLAFSPSYACTFYEIQVSRRIHHGPGRAALWQRILDWRRIHQPRVLLSRQAFLRAHRGYQVAPTADGDYRLARKITPSRPA